MEFCCSAVDPWMSQIIHLQTAPLLKLMGIKEKLVSLPCVVHWTLIFNLQQAKPIKAPAIFPAAITGGVKGQCITVSCPSPAQRWMALNPHPRKETRQLPEVSSCRIIISDSCMFPPWKSEGAFCYQTLIHCRDNQSGWWFWQSCNSVFC